MKRFAIITRLTMVILILVLISVFVLYSLRRSAAGHASATAPSEAPPVVTVHPEITSKTFSPSDPDKLIWQPLVYPGNDVYFNSVGVSHNTPQIELRVWQLNGTKKVPWVGRELDLYCTTMRITASTDAGQVPCWSFPYGDPGNGYIPMRAVRMALLSPQQYSPEINGPVDGVMRLGQTYDVRLRSLEGKYVGYNRITIPEKLENDQIVVFNLIANTIDSPDEASLQAAPEISEKFQGIWRSTGKKDDTSVLFEARRITVVSGTVQVPWAVVGGEGLLQGLLVKRRDTVWNAEASVKSNEMTLRLGDKTYQLRQWKRVLFGYGPIPYPWNRIMTEEQMKTLMSAEPSVKESVIMPREERKLSPDDFGRVKVGMTVREVLASLGLPDSKEPNSFRYVAYSNPHHGYSLTILFVDGKVSELKNRHWIELPGKD
jgi:hypothetical protein